MELWKCGCGATHHLQPSVANDKGGDYTCAFCGHVKGQDAPTKHASPVQAQETGGTPAALPVVAETPALAPVPSGPAGIGEPVEISRQVGTN